MSSAQGENRFELSTIKNRFLNRFQVFLNGGPATKKPSLSDGAHPSFAVFTNPNGTNLLLKKAISIAGREPIVIHPHLRASEAQSETEPLVRLRQLGSTVRVSINPALSALRRARNILLLQGPVGPFYDRMTAWLQAGGAKVSRVVFHGGDLLDTKYIKPVEYRGNLLDWPAFMRAEIDRLGIDCIVLFGQSRAYHVPAIELGHELDIPAVVLEEGYFRPGYITMELGGVNGYSTTLERYHWQPLGLAEAGLPLHTTPGDIEPHISPNHFRKMAWHATKHYAALHRNRSRFPDYIHHRPVDPYLHFAYWIRSWMRKFKARERDLQLQCQLFSEGRPYFFVPLQHEGDAQITEHSPFKVNQGFIEVVMRSFAHHARQTALLVFRQHPHARGGPGHSQIIGELAAQLGVTHRVLHMVEGDTPDLAQRSCGVVLINSTVGLQALERNAPLMVMGDSLYKRPGLCFNGAVDRFWREAARPDIAARDAFFHQIKNLTQASASVYANRDEPLNWGPHQTAIPRAS